MLRGGRFRRKIEPADILVWAQGNFRGKGELFVAGRSDAKERAWYEDGPVGIVVGFEIQNVGQL